jgi:hypothetical protein
MDQVPRGHTHGAAEVLVLRPHRFLMALWLALGIPALVVAAIGWGLVVTDKAVGWPMAVIGTLVAVPALASALRARLILTPEGFRWRSLLRGRLVPWDSVARFSPIDDSGMGLLPMPGVMWVPRGFTFPRTRLGWLGLGWKATSWQLPVCGKSREHMLETLNGWRERYSGAASEAPAETRHLHVTVNADRLKGENPEQYRKLMDLIQRKAAGKSLGLMDLSLLEELAEEQGAEGGRPTDT